MSENFQIGNYTIAASAAYETLVEANVTQTQLKSIDTDSDFTITEDELAVFIEDETEETENGTSSAASTTDLKILNLQEQYKDELDEAEKLIKKMQDYQTKKNKLETKLAQLSEDDTDRAQRYESRISSYESKIDSTQSKIDACFQNMTDINNQILEVSTEEAALAESSGGTTTYSCTGATYTGESIPEELASSLDAKLGEGFSEKCESVAASLNCNVNDLLAMMYSESGISTTATNSSSGAVGLIQFMPSTLSANGYSSSEVANMSAVEQLSVVEDIMLKLKATAGYSQSDELDTGSLYAICFLPAAAQNETVCSSGGTYSWAYSGNSGLDLDGDGAITKTDLANRLNSKYSELLSAYT